MVGTGLGRKVLAFTTAEKTSKVWIRLGGEKQCYGEKNSKIVKEKSVHRISFKEAVRLLLYTKKHSTDR